MMDFGIGILLIGGIVFLAYNAGAFTTFGIPPPTGAAGGEVFGTPASPYANPSGLQANVQFNTPPMAISDTKVTSVNPTQLALTSAGSVAGAAAMAPASFAALGLTGAAAGAAVAGIGVVVAIAAALYAAHLARAKQATDENSAMNLGVIGIDKDLAMVNAAYNSRQISASDAISLVNQLFHNYWALVTPHIQPGRNGCAGGGSCPPWPTGGNGCSGSIGAACCVGCYDLAGDSAAKVFSVADGGDGVTPMHWGVHGVIAVLQTGGGKVHFPRVYPSKYGGKDRPAYNQSWLQISHA